MVIGIGYTGAVRKFSTRLCGQGPDFLPPWEWRTRRVAAASDPHPKQLIMMD
jgi:hypothetical protein